MIKTILVPLLGRPVDGTTLEAAYGIAHLFEAHLDCLHVEVDLYGIAARGSTFDAGGMLLSQAMWDALEENARRLAKASRVAFDEFRRKHDVPVVEVPPSPGRMSLAYRETAGDFTSKVVEASCTRDVIVMGREETFAVDFGDILVSSGKPLLIGASASGKTVASTIAIAWKETAEAARAVTAAMPLLEKASKVVALAAAESGFDSEAAIESTNRLATQLSWHGIDCETRCVMPSNNQSGRLLDAVTHCGADLLVMGAYGHSRAREFILGGFTRHILDSGTLPVLMAH